MERKRTEEENSKFIFKVCNNSSSTIVVAIAYFSPEIREWMVKGWYSFQSGECSQINKFQRGNFYYYAVRSNDNAAMNGGDLKLCAPNKVFSYVNINGYICDNIGDSRDFKKITVNEEEYTARFGD